jgi:hypothetical protein
MSEGAKDDDSLSSLSVEIGYAVKAPKAGPAIRAPRWTEWDGGQLGGRPVR